MGYIRVDRKILEWEWYKDKNTKTLFLHCLIKANWKQGNFKGQSIARGSFVTSLSKLSSECDLSMREVRTALEHLKKTGEVTCKASNSFSIITVTNYDMYQTDDTQNDKPKKKINTPQEENHDSEAEALFEKLWSMYPFIKSRKSSVTLAKKRKIYSEIGEKQFIRAIERFKQHKCNDDPQYVVRASTFFNTTYADYLDDTYKETMNISDETTDFNNGQTKRNLQ